MKKYVLTLFALILLAGTSCQEKIDIEKEKEAIMAVLKERGDAMIANDMERLFAIHVQDSLDTRLDYPLGENNYTIYAGWDDIKSYFESWAEMDRAGEDLRNWEDNVILKVIDDCAWLICDNHWSWKIEGEPGVRDNIQITFLEKIEGEWKISFTAFVTKPEPEHEEDDDDEEVEEGEGESETVDTE
jgi:hypothetical protein